MLEKGKLKILVIFLAFVALLTIWLFYDNTDSSQERIEAEYEATTQRSAIDEEEAAAEAEENKDLIFYLWQDTDKNGDVITEYITLDPSQNKIILSVLVNYDVENVAETTGSYFVSGTDIAAYLGDKEYKGTLNEDESTLTMDGKTYYVTDDGYI